jgi:uncharacterized Zn-finger protein
LGDFKLGFSASVYCTKWTLNTSVNSDIEITHCPTLSLMEIRQNILIIFHFLILQFGRGNTQDSGTYQSQCGEAFQANTSIPTHSGQLFCEMCKKGFREKSDFIAHVQMHTGMKVHLCNICGKCFRDRYKLMRHMIIHTGEKPFKCTLCGKCFNQNAILRRHMTVHIKR